MGCDGGCGNNCFDCDELLALIRNNAGPAGIQGLQGPVGPRGFQGTIGDIGLNGPIGPQGAPGVQGSGITAATANTLPPGSSATAVYDITTETITLGIPQGIQGPPGQPMTGVDSGWVDLDTGTAFTLNPASKPQFRRIGGLMYLRGLLTIPPVGARFTYGERHQKNLHATNTSEVTVIQNSNNSFLKYNLNGNPSNFYDTINGIDYLSEADGLNVTFSTRKFTNIKAERQTEAAEVVNQSQCPNFTYSVNVTAISPGNTGSGDIVIGINLPDPNNILLVGTSDAQYNATTPIVTQFFVRNNTTGQVITGIMPEPNPGSLTRLVTSNISVPLNSFTTFNFTIQIDLIDQAGTCTYARIANNFNVLISNNSGQLSGTDTFNYTITQDTANARKFAIPCITILDLEIDLDGYIKINTVLDRELQDNTVPATVKISNVHPLRREVSRFGVNQNVTLYTNWGQGSSSGSNTYDMTTFNAIFLQQANLNEAVGLGGVGINLDGLTFSI